MRERVVHRLLVGLPRIGFHVEIVLGTEGRPVVAQEADVVLRGVGHLAALGIHLELVAAPGGFSRRRHAEKDDAVLLQFVARRIARDNDLGTCVQSQHTALVGQPHGLAEETLLVLAEVVAAEADVEVELGHGEDLLPALMLFRDMDHRDRRSGSSRGLAEQVAPHVGETGIAPVAHAQVQRADRIEVRIVAHLPRKLDEGQGLHPVQHLVEFLGGALDHFLLVRKQ